MRQWFVTQLGDPQDALQLQESPKPSVEAGKVLIQVDASSLNFFDILLCQGKYQEKPQIPFTPGAEVSGVIREIGKGSQLEVGQRVIATPPSPNGGLSEWVSVAEENVYVASEKMSAGEAAAMFITYHTAYYALYHRANLQKDEVLLVHAGAGGVGSAAIQLGLAKGAKVIATAGGPEKVQLCKELGADIAIDYRSEDFVYIVKKETGGNGADVIFDPVGSDVFDRSRKCIAFDGRILVIGFAGGRIPEAPVNHALIKNYSIVGVHWGLFHKRNPDKVTEIHQDLMRLYDESKIKPLVYKEYYFGDVPTALEELADRKTYGKLIVKP